jgi:cellulose synthase/poly-beta-1,6-N-acetylglucosamine synthase-like glycosyltransferase
MTARPDPIGVPVSLTDAEEDERAIYAARARRLGLAFTEAVDLGTGGQAGPDAIRRGMFAVSNAGERLIYFAPNELAMPDTQAWLNAHPADRGRARISTPTAIRAALIKANEAALVESAVSRLATQHPEFSARLVASSGQIVAGIVLAAIMLAAFIFAPLALLLAIDILAAIFFFGVSAIRFIAAGHTKNRAPINDRLREKIAAGPLPIYTVLVPLYGEAAVAGDLIAALDQLEWPRDRLDIKLLLEESDSATIAAVRKVVTGAPYEIIVVPDRLPRTKPKALSFALPFARGEFVTVYDAEDKPHPGQLLEAYTAFAQAGPDLACIQASLVIDNGSASWLSLLFSIEYAALFDGLLPTLSALDMPLPLGGTSNHFRKAALEEVGGWDPYNVTEDADLGLRLARFGYRADTISSPTLEDAPTTLMPWIKQRTRWFKGWMQTWLVHTRHPVRLVRELKFRGLIGFALTGTGLIVSSLIYPVYLITLAVMVTNPLSLWGDGSVIASAIIGVNLFNLVAGFLGMGMLSARALRRRGRHEEARGLYLLPLYWLLMSAATYRALWQLVRKPHHWEKTPHRRRANAPT